MWRVLSPLLGGWVLHKGKFIPYDDGAPIQQRDLVITQKSGDGWVSIADGSTWFRHKIMKQAEDTWTL
jgi:hypothetical protein